MEKTTIYEYMPDGDKIIKLQHSAEISKAKDRYVLKAGKSEKQYKYLSNTDLESVVNNHVFSLEDNFEKYRDMIIDCMEARIQATEVRLAKSKELLQRLKCAAVEG